MATLKDAAGNVLLDRQIDWVSSDPTVATTVHDGAYGFIIVNSFPWTPVSVPRTGTTTVSAISEGHMASATITVINPVYSVSLEPDKGAILPPGTKIAYAATPSGKTGFAVQGATVTWSTSNAAVASVDANGVVTALSSGSATISATSDEKTAGVVMHVQDPVSMGTLAWLNSKYATACAINTSGSAFCWGDGEYGQLGNGDTASSFMPIPVAGAVSFSMIAPGDQHTCGLSTTGAAFCWGYNYNGQLGDNTRTQSLAPVPVTGGHTFTTVGAGSEFSCGLDTAGLAYCWGWNGFGWGMLGNPAYSNSSVPVPVVGGHTFSSLTVGLLHACGLTIDGAAYCWGVGTWGELGNGSTADQVSPVLVSGSLAFASLRAGVRQTCGLTAAGAAYCWGNDASSLGFYGSRVPVRVACCVAFNAGSLDVGGHACALESGGTAQCWGGASPEPVLGGFSFSSIRPGYRFTCGLTTNSVAYCWGRNELGELGNGTDTRSDLPVKVLGQP
ncbi:MAG: Ig-like domain-containing protein [Gemmatimonadota bacterium]|nr:Ig-like domain-containing protein [Gemmatimonadota bacterium]